MYVIKNNEKKSGSVPLNLIFFSDVFSLPVHFEFFAIFSLLFTFCQIFRGCVVGPHTVVRKHVYNCSRIFKAADHILYMWVWAHVRTLYSTYIWERVQDGKKQEWQKCPAGTRQTDGKNWGLVWRNRKKISQIIKDYFHLPFFLLIILWLYCSSAAQAYVVTPFSHGEPENVF